jgi:peptide/nickel transport system substrate-binding protein
MRRVCALAIVIVSAMSVSAAPGRAGGDDTVRVGYDLETVFTNLDPSKSLNTCDKNIWTLLYDSVLREGPGSLEPGLADSWEIAPDGSSVTLHFPPGRTYQDGTPLTAETIRQGLEYNAENVGLSSVFARIASYDVLDDEHLKLNLTDPYPLRLLFDLTGQAGMVVAPSAFGSADERPVGAGPFKFKSYSPGQSLELVLDEQSPEAGEYEIRGVEYVQVATGNPAVTALRAGDIDVARITADSLNAAKQSGLGISSVATGEFVQLAFRYSRGSKTTPFADPLVRQAVSYAIDRKVLNKVVEAGTAVVSATHYPPDSPFFVPELQDAYRYSPNKAKALLKEAGYPKGFEIEIVLPSGVSSQERQAERVQDMLAEVGIDAKVIKALPQDVFLTFYQRMQGDALSARQLQSSLGPGTLANLFGEGQQLAIRTGSVDDTITMLTDQAYRATDEAELVRITKEMEQYAVDNALDVPIGFVRQFVAYDKSRLAGKPGAPYDSCVPIDLRGVRVK